MQSRRAKLEGDSGVIGAISIIVQTIRVKQSFARSRLQEHNDHLSMPLVYMMLIWYIVLVEIVGLGTLRH